MVNILFYVFEAEADNGNKGLSADSEKTRREV